MVGHHFLSNGETMDLEQLLLQRPGLHISHSSANGKITSSVTGGGDGAGVSVGVGDGAGVSVGDV